MLLPMMHLLLKILLVHPLSTRHSLLTGLLWKTHKARISNSPELSLVPSEALAEEANSELVGLESNQATELQGFAGSFSQGSSQGSPLACNFNPYGEAILESH